MKLHRELPGRRARRIAYQLQNVGEIMNRGWEIEQSLDMRALSISSTLSLTDSRVRAVAAGEIDVMENVGDPSWVNAALHGPHVAHGFDDVVVVCIVNRCRRCAIRGFSKEMMLTFFRGLRRATALSG